MCAVVCLEQHFQSRSAHGRGRNIRQIMSETETQEVTMEDVEDEDLVLTSTANNNNNNVREENNNNIFHKLTDRPLNIQVTAKVLFGSVTAISALNAERKKKPGSPPPPPSTPPQ